MRKARNLLLAVALASGLAVSLGATAAQAATLRNVYYEVSDCNRYGSYGVDNGLWPSYTCTWVSNGSSTWPYGFWFLYA